MLDWDRQLFYLLNTQWSHPWLDTIMPILTDLHKNRFFLTTLAPVLLGLWIWRKKQKMIPVLMGLVVCIACTDNANHRILKPLFARPRPPLVEKQIVLRAPHAGGLSFPSNHAGNMFAAATFLSACYPGLSYFYFLIAILISYSRVYVGVHYPLDVAAGALVGMIFGLLIFKLLYIILARTYEKGHKSFF